MGSSANLTRLVEVWQEVQSLVYRNNRYGERTQPCGTPVLVVKGGRQVTAKLHLLRPVGKEVCNPLADGAGTCSCSSRSARIVLKAKVKSTNTALTYT